ncbi:putative protein OS=Rhizobacter sp. Root404 OX=1736528 GN=ASC76_07330 PE=4 SV=1 [Rhizobacter fulvus]
MKRLGVERTTHHAALFRAGDQAGGFEHGQVLHEAGQRHAVRLREFADAEAGVGTRLRQLGEHAAAGRVRQRGEHEVQMRSFFVNHTV